MTNVRGTGGNGRVTNLPLSGAGGGDCRQLKWWSMIQTTGYYGWGVGKTALDATNFWGITVSSATRD